MTNWINKVCVSSYGLKEIKDEYEYLYNDYLYHFNLHKMKYSYSKFDCLVKAVDEFSSNLVSGKFITAFRDLLSVKKTQLQFLQEEAKLPGKEIAFIHTTARTFGKSES